jgi:hypothetical protein
MLRYDRLFWQISDRPLPVHLFEQSAGRPLDPLRAEFIKYILSKDGQTLTEEGGYFPISNEIREHELETLGNSALAN